MSVVVGLLAAAGVLMWPSGFGLRPLAVLPISQPLTVLARSTSPKSIWELVCQRWSGRRAAEISAPDLLGLLEAIAPALEAGIAHASALQIAADARSGSGGTDAVAALARRMAAAAADGATLGPLWREAAESADSAELLLLAQAWSLTEDMGAPLAQAVRTTATLLEARIAHERRLAAAVAGAKATVNVLTVLPLGGPLLGLVLGIGPAELYGGSGLTQASLVLGVCLAALGRWWVRRMVRAVARGPVIS